MNLGQNSFVIFFLTRIKAWKLCAHEKLWGKEEMFTMYWIKYYINLKLLHQANLPVITMTINQ